MLSPLRTLKLIVSSYRLYRDPEALDSVFSIVDAISTPEHYLEMEAHLRSHPSGALAIDERPRLGHIDMEALAALPQGTLGRAFSDFIVEKGLEPEVLVDQAEQVERYVSVHLYETHDLWHVVTGFDTDAVGELGLQAFYLAQHPWERLAPIAMGIAMFKVALDPEVSFGASELLEQLARGWRMGKRAKPLFGLRWAERWEQPLSALKRELNVHAAPELQALPTLTQAVA